MTFDTLATSESIEKTSEGLKVNNFEPIVVDTKEAALEKIKELIPKGASVINGSSVTLDEIGYIEYLKSGKHGWNNLHEAILSEKDPVKSKLLRKSSTISDFYLGSVHALTETGEIMIASNTGSQIPSIAFNSNNLIFVVSSQKIVSSLSEAFKRIDSYVVPLEDARMMKASGVHTLHSKTFIYHKERPNSGRTIRVIIVKENLGF